MKWNERRKVERERGKRGQGKHEEPREAEEEAKNGNDLMTLRRDMHIC